MGRWDKHGYDELGRSQRVNLQNISEYMKKDILAVDRMYLPESNRKQPLFPFQRTIMREFAKRQFLWIQILRGGSKCEIATAYKTLADGSRVQLKDLIGKNFEIPVLANGDVCTGMHNADGHSIPQFKDGETFVINSKAFASDNGVQKCYRVTTTCGAVIEGSFNHPLLTLKGWVALKDLKANQTIAVTRKTSAEGTVRINEDELKFIAYMLTDGSCTSGIVEFYQVPGVVADEFVEVCKRLGMSVSISTLPNSRGNRYECHGQGPGLKSIAREILAKYNIYGSNHREKHIPEKIFTCPNDQVALFFSRFFSCAGLVSSGPSTYTPEISIRLSSKRFIYDIRSLMLRLGIRGFITEKINPEAMQDGLSWVWSTSGCASIINFTEAISILGKESKQSVAYDNAVSSHRLDKFPNTPHADFDWSEIKSVNYIGNFPTVAIEVPMHHTIVGDFIEHNTYSIARASLCYALQNAGIPIVFTAPSFRQSLLIYDEVRKIIDLNDKDKRAPLRVADEVKGDIKRNSLESIMYFHNGSSIRALPLGDGCLTAGAMILLGDKFSPISNCFTPELNCELTAKGPNTLWTIDGWRESDEWYANGVKPTKRITTKHGYTIEGTHNHRIRVESNGQLEWKRLDEIALSDKVPLDTSQRWHNGSTASTNDQCYTLGFLSGENFPKEILGASQAQMIFFIQGLYDSGGYVTVFNNRTEPSYGELNFTHSSYHLIRELQTVLLHFGIVTTTCIRNKHVEEYQRSYDLKISGKALRLFHERINLKRDKNKLLLQELVDKETLLDNSGELHAADVFLDEVSLVEDGEAATFDCHVPDGNEYIANGFLSHNSKIRGIRGGILVIDEFFQITEEVFSSHIMPFVGVRQGGMDSKIIFSTTSWFQDCFAYRRLMQMVAEVKAGNEAYGVLDYNLHHVERSGFPLAKEIHKDARRHGEPVTYAMTYYNVWPRTSARWFQQLWIDNAISSIHGVRVETKPEPGAKYFVVVDLASSEKGDSSFLIVFKWEDNKSKAVWAHEELGMKPSDRAWMVHKAYLLFNPDFIIYDSHGAIGSDLRKELAQKEILAEGLLRKVTPIVTHDAYNLSGNHILIPVGPKDKAVKAALLGPTDGTEMRGEIGMNEQLMKQARDILADGGMVGPGKVSLPNDEKGREAYTYDGSELQIMETLRKAFNQLGCIGPDKDDHNNIILNQDGLMRFTSNGKHDDGAMCLIYSVIGINRLLGRFKLAAQAIPINQPMMPDELKGYDLRQPIESIQRICM